MDTLLSPDGVSRQKALRIAWQFATVGFCTPILVGVVLRCYLLFSGKPYMKWSDAIRFMDLLAPPLILPCIPFGVLGLITYMRVSDTAHVGESLYGAFIGGEITSIVAYWLWWHDPEGLFEMSHFEPFIIPFVIGSGMLLGLGIGWVLRKLRRPRQHVLPLHSN
jgi:hypothetical protein